MKSKTYRILHVIDSFGLGGAQEVLLNLLKYADRTRFAPEVACLHGRGPYWERIAPLGLPMYSLSPRKWLPIYAPRLFGLCRARGYAIVHCHLFGSNAIGKPMARLAGVRVLFNHDHCNGDDRLLSQTTLRIDRATNRLSSHIVAVSESTRQFLVKHEGIAPERITAIHNGVDLARYRPVPSSAAGEKERQRARAQWELPEDAVVVAGVGRLHPQKNFPMFLRVAARVVAQNPRILFVIAGEGPDRAALEAEAARLGLGPERCRFLGFVRDVMTLYPAVDVFLLPSLYEGTPMTILEAMACGMAIVASRLDGMAEILEDGRDCFLVDSGDEAGFADRVARLAADEVLRRGFAAAALQKVREGYSAEIMTRRVEELYLRFLES